MKWLVVWFCSPELASLVMGSLAQCMGSGVRVLIFIVWLCGLEHSI